jgi:glycosyltransferase 2 family protein
MPASMKKGIKIAAIVLVTGGLLFLSFRKVNWADVLRYGVNVHPLLFLLVVACVPLHLVTRAVRWRYLLIHEKKDVRFWSLFSAGAIGFTVSYILPGRVGEIVRPLVVARKEGVRPGFVIGTIVVERIFDIMTMCALLGIFLLARPLVAAGFQIKPEAAKILNLWGFIGVAASLGLLAVCLLFYLFREKAVALCAKVFKRLLPARFLEKVLELLHEFIDGLKFFHSLGNMLIYIGLSFVVWLGITFFYWIFFAAYGLGLPFVLLIPYIFMTGVGASIPTPGMVGGFEWFSITGLTLLFGVDQSQAAGLTIVVHALQLVVTCLLGYVILWKEGLSLLQLKNFRETMTP